MIYIVGMEMYVHLVIQLSFGIFQGIKILILLFLNSFFLYKDGKKKSIGWQ
jgi:hypothetical protein